MAYPYKKMTSQDCDYIRSVTAPDRVWAGEEIASEYYRDEMPEYGVYQPDLYVGSCEQKKKYQPIMHMRIKKISRWSAVEREPAWQEELPANTAVSCYPLCG